jgi:hypothetical protein
MEVKFESPAARKAAGKRKLNEYINGCAMADIKIRVKMVGTISSSMEKRAVIEPLLSQRGSRRNRSTI